MADVSEQVRVERPVDHVVVVTLDRPEKRNALSMALRDAVCDELDVLADDATLKVVVVTGAGTTFSAGFDLGEFEPLGSSAEYDARFGAAFDRWHRTVLAFPLPTIAAVNGPALAGGFDLAVMCDLRVAASTARFAHPELAFSDVVYTPLLDLVGGAVARELCLTGRNVDAEEALALHLVSSVVPPEQVVDEAIRVATEIARAPRDVLVRTKAKAVRRAAAVADGHLDL